MSVRIPEDRHLCKFLHRNTSGCLSLLRHVPAHGFHFLPRFSGNHSAIRRMSYIRMDSLQQAVHLHRQMHSCTHLQISTLQSFLYTHPVHGAFLHKCIHLHHGILCFLHLSCLDLHVSQSLHHVAM